MGDVDDFVRTKMAAELRPGEEIRGVGAAVRPQRRPSFDHFLVAATSERLVLFKTKAKMMSDQPQVLSQGVEVWEYADLAEVRLGEVGPRWSRRASVGRAHNANAMELVPLPGRGPRGGHPLVLRVRAVVAGCDDQLRLRNQYPAWLAEQVAAGRSEATRLQRRRPPHRRRRPRSPPRKRDRRPLRIAPPSPSAGWASGAWVCRYWSSAAS